MDTRYTSRSPRRRRNTDQWECSLSHTDPVTGEVVRTYHTLVAKTQRLGGTRTRLPRRGT